MATLINTGNLRPKLVIEGNPQRAIVFLFHGFDDTASSWAFLAEALAQSLPYVTFILPTAPRQAKSGASWFLQDYCGRPPDIEQTRLEILELVETECCQRHVPLNHVIFFGISQGAWMASWVALQLPICCSGLVLFSGGTHDALEINEMAKRTPVLHCMGANDPVVSPSDMRKCSGQLRRAGLRVRYVEFPGLGHEIAGEAIESALQFIRSVIPRANQDQTRTWNQSLAGEIKRLHSLHSPTVQVGQHTAKGINRALAATDRVATDRVEFWDSEGDRLAFSLAQNGGVNEYCNGRLVVSQLQELRIDRTSGACDDGEGTFTLPVPERGRTIEALRALFTASGARVVFVDVNKNK